jgi:phage-related protein
MPPTYDFRQFQADLAKIDSQADPSSNDPMAQAKAEFLELRKRHKLTVADVVAFFPEEEGVEYILSLMQKPTGKRGMK